MNPTRGDWVSNITKIMKIIELNISFKEIKIIKKITYKQTELKVRKAVLKYLLLKRKSK